MIKHKYLHTFVSQASKDSIDQFKSAFLSKYKIALEMNVWFGLVKNKNE